MTSERARSQANNGEVITMEIVGEFLGKDCDKTIWGYVKWVSAN